VGFELTMLVVIGTYTVVVNPTAPDTIRLDTLICFWTFEFLLCIYTVQFTYNEIHKMYWLY
jgi:hypothetical protein